MNLQKALESYQQKKIPDTIEGEGYENNIYSTFKLRQEFTEDMGIWCLVAQDWVDLMVEKWMVGKRVLEVIGGTGLLAKAIRKTHKCKRVVVTDDLSWEKKGITDIVNFDTEVIEMDAVESIEVYGWESDVLVMSWMPYDQPLAYKVMQAWGKSKPIVFIGEGQGGCTADDAFFNGFREEDYLDIPQFAGLHDYVSMGYWHLN